MEVVELVELVEVVDKVVLVTSWIKDVKLS